MSETKHTPGEWEFQESDWHDFVIGQKDGRKVYLLEVTSDENGVWDIEEGRANGRLATAAPDLLAIVEKFVKDIDAVGHLQVMKEWPDVADPYGRAIVALGKLTD